MKIELTKGYYATVDAEDFPMLCLYSWHVILPRSGPKACTSVRVPGAGAKVRPEVIYMHRLIMGAKDRTYVDHINHDTLDNRKSNLRVCTNSENCRNRKLNKASNSGYKGVHWFKESKKWTAAICVNYRQIHLGSFTTKEEAAMAYNNAAIKYHGEFASLNNF